MRLIFTLCFFATLLLQSGPYSPETIRKTKQGADAQSAQFAKEVEIIYKTQPPIPYGWGVVLGFGLGIVFTAIAQWLERLVRDAKAHREHMTAPPAPQGPSG